jgi:5-formyltetrahydrofolate cyclo-ligase
MVLKKKRELRKRVQEERDRLSPEAITARSEVVLDRLWSLPEFKAANTVFFFVSFRSEVDTVPMIKRALAEGKRVCLPYTIVDNREMVASQVLDFDHDLELGNYDIMEPREEFIRPVLPEEIDVIIMPGVAFDDEGRRLGYGGGYYDRFLDHCEPHCLRIALCFDLQVVEDVPCADHDHRIHIIVTDQRIINCDHRAT